MRKILSLLLVTLLAFGLMVSDAQAKRFGGGRSFGVQRSMTKPVNNSGAFNQMQRPLNGASKWLAPLAGLALGGLLATLLMGNGLGSGLLSWLLIAGVIFLIFKFMRSRSQAFADARYYQQQNAASDAARQSYSPFMSQASSASQTQQAPICPSDFDSAGFLREARAQFIRLQAAYDQKDINDIRQFTTPEVYAEIQLQLQERGDASNQTEVVSLNADLIEATNESSYAMTASVQFSGVIREEANGSPVSLNEIWHFRKDDYHKRWMVSGVQQN